VEWRGWISLDFASFCLQRSQEQKNTCSGEVGENRWLVGREQKRRDHLFSEKLQKESGKGGVEVVGRENSLKEENAVFPMHRQQGKEADRIVRREKEGKCRELLKEVTRALLRTALLSP